MPTSSERRGLLSLDRFDPADLGIDALGACSAEPFRQVRSDIEDRIAEERHGGLRFTYGDPEASTDVSRSFPWARTLIVAGRSYVPASGNPRPSPGRARIARFATEDHYRPLRRALHSVRDDLQQAGHRAQVLCDDNRLVDRAAAVRAGLGWWGKSTMVIAPRVGPWMLFGSVVTDAQIEFTNPMLRDCGTCSACVPACPTGALDEPGVLDVRRCLSAVLQQPGSIPSDLREAVGDRLYGCDDCLTACPPGQRLASQAESDIGADLATVLTTPDDELLDRYQHFYIPRRDARYLRRNALVALGNSGDERHVPLVESFLNHTSGLLRSHAAWALGRIAGADARRVLEDRLEKETVADVRQEIRAALVET